MNREEMELLADGLKALVAAGMGARSRWALRTAVDAAQSEGIGGVLIMKIPPRTKDECEVHFQWGTPRVEITDRWSNENDTRHSTGTG